MSQPQLSILIPSIPSRFARAQDCYRRIMEMVGDRDIEVLMLTDNKKRSIGAKREALKNASIGKYFMFCDDDDSLFSIYEIYDASFMGDPDVITFKAECLNSDKSKFIVTFGLGYPVEHNTENGRYLDCKRPPFHVCAWHHKFKQFSYPDVSYSEDWEWVKQCLPVATTERHIDKVLFGYNFDPVVSEASTESNEHWVNPNGDFTEAYESRGQEINERGARGVFPNPAMPRRAIVTVATAAYWPGADRLEKSLKDKFDGDFSGHTSEAEVGAPPHTENPYAFKVYAIEKLFREGYDQILWLDASVYAVKDMSPVFDRIAQYGIFMEEAGHYVGKHCNQHCLDYFHLTREQAMTMPMFSAGMIGFDFNNPMAKSFFYEWKNAMIAGCFKGSWADHRHDMTVASIIANKLDLVKDYSPGGTYFAYVGEGYEKPKETAVAHLRGI